MDSTILTEEEEQALNADLRENFLKSLLFAIDKPVTFRLHENTTVKGIFSAVDSEQLQVLVTNLETPSGVLKQAVLRTSDIISFSLDLE